MDRFRGNIGDLGLIKAGMKEFKREWKSEHEIRRWQSEFEKIKVLKSST
jgi:hypothetical protein